MEFISWNDKLSVGVKIFDEEHKQLISFLNKLNQSILSGSTAKTMGEILANLVRYTRIHFKHEQDYMTAHGYPDYDMHKKEHDSLTTQVAEYNERLKSGKTTYSLELLNFLRDWLTKHIQGSDMNYKNFFISKGVR